MARYKDADWSLPEGKIETWQQVEIAVLMDIRDELKAINRKLDCPNIQQMFADLRAMGVEARAARRTRLKK